MKIYPKEEIPSVKRSRKYKKQHASYQFQSNHLPTNSLQNYNVHMKSNYDFQK